MGNKNKYFYVNEEHNYWTKINYFQILINKEGIYI